MPIQFLRPPAVLELSKRSRSAYYNDVALGLATRPVRIGRRAVATPKHEVDAINAARLAGADDDQVRQLVVELHAARKTYTFHWSGDVPLGGAAGLSAVPSYGAKTAHSVDQAAAPSHRNNVSTNTLPAGAAVAVLARPIARRRPIVGAPAPPPKTSHTWNAYCHAYLSRWGVEPLRNAKVNGMLARFIERVPASEAPSVAAFFVSSNRGLYVSAKHAISLLLRDAESLRTEWATGRASTDTEARQADRTQATGNAFAGLIAEAEERERATNGRI